MTVYRLSLAPSSSLNPAFQPYSLKHYVSNVHTHLSLLAARILLHPPPRIPTLLLGLSKSHGVPHPEGHSFRQAAPPLRAPATMVHKKFASIGLPNSSGTKVNTVA